MIGVVFFFFTQKTAYEMRISDWSSDVCSSDLRGRPALASPITRRCLPDMTPEHAGQMLLVRKSAAMGNLRDGLLRVAKQIFRPLDPAAHHILMRRHSHLGSELPGEV